MIHPGFLIPVVVAGFMLGMVIGFGRGQEIERKAAVQNNCAHWSIDSITGEKIFVYGSK